MKKFVDWFFGLNVEGNCVYPSYHIRTIDPDTPFEFVCNTIRGFTSVTEMISLALLVLKILGYFDGSLIIVFSPVICRVVLELIANLARKFARKRQGYYNKIAREARVLDIASMHPSSIVAENLFDYEYIPKHENEEEEDGDTF